MPSTRTAAKSRYIALLVDGLSRLPLPVLYALSTLLYGLLFHLAGYQRKLLLENLRRAFADKPPAEIQRLAAASYRNALDFLIETLKAWRIGESELGRRVVLDNPQCLYALAQKHKVVLVLTSHHGNWEWLQLACASRLELPIAVLYNPLNDAGLDHRVRLMRERFGTRMIDARRSLRELVAFARGGGVIALNADQLPRPEETKYWQRFLGIDTAFFTGPERLARLFHAPVVFVRLQRTARGHYRASFERLLEPPYPPDGTRVMQAYVEAVEGQVRASPQDWFWLYKRWKYRRKALSGQ